MIALIDMDLVAYRCSAASENDVESDAHRKCDSLMNQLLDETGATGFRGFLSGEDNFRYKIDPLYKANRKEQKEPRYRQSCKEYLCSDWEAKWAVGHEADDALAMAQADGTIIVSLDKDLLQVPGKHYQWRIEGGPADRRWVKEATWWDITTLEGLRNFYISSLVGDTSDNIIGVSGIGKVKARKLLSDCSTENEMFDTCRQSYNEDERYFRNLKLLWLMREEGDVFDPQKRGLID
jgi:5'-3' exonuclease